MLNGNSTQSHRLVRLTTVLAKDALIATRFQITETVSQGFTMTVTAFSETEHGLTTKDLVGTMATIALVQTDNSLRYFNGYIQELASTGSQRSGQRSTYRITIVSWLELLLAKQTDARIFQEQSVTDIIKEVFKRYGTVAKYKIETSASHPVWRYCTQYNESDLDFFNRICHRAGLAYYFKHENGVHTLHIVDNGDAFDTLAPEIVKIQPGTNAHDHFTSWTSVGTFVTGKYAQRTYNYLKPTDQVPVEDSSSGDTAKVPRVLDVESYLYSEGYHSPGEGKADIQRRIDQGTSRAHVATGAGDCRHLKVGHHFQVELSTGGDFADKGKSFTFTQVSISADDTSGALSCAVEAVPKGTLRYPSAKAPVINSLQTAVVTGPAGEEIHTDKLGRIKAQFHWDRLGAGDDKTTCWLRVMQGFAGSSFGAHFTPRIGHEVVVAFENGNPDRPFVIGSLYHPENAPPYGDQLGTRAGIRTRSTKGGGVTNCNELYFEDTKGKEEVYFQAEKDYNQLVKNDSSTVVQHDKRLQVDNDRTAYIKNNCTTKIDNNKALQVGNNETQKIGNNLTTTIGNKGLIKADTELTLQVGGSVIKITGSKIEISSTQVVINGSSVKIN